MPDAPQGRVLIIDDDPGDGELAVRRLRSLPARVDFHLGPDGAVEEVARGEYDVVVLDPPRTGVDGVFDKFLHDAGGPLDDFTGGDLVDQQFGQDAYRHGWRC